MIPATHAHAELDLRETALVSLRSFRAACLCRMLGISRYLALPDSRLNDGIRMELRRDLERRDLIDEMIASLKVMP